MITEQLFDDFVKSFYDAAGQLKYTRGDAYEYIYNFVEIKPIHDNWSPQLSLDDDIITVTMDLVPEDADDEDSFGPLATASSAQYWAESIISRMNPVQGIDVKASRVACAVESTAVSGKYYVDIRIKLTEATQ